MIVYETNEKVMSPWPTVKNWPNVIRHPSTPNGRLVKRNLEDLKLFKAYKMAFCLLSLQQKKNIITALKQLHDGKDLSEAIEKDFLEIKVK